MTEPNPLHIPIRQVNPGAGLNPNFWPVSMPNGLDPAAVAPDPTEPGGPLEHVTELGMEVTEFNPDLAWGPPLTARDELSEGDVIRVRSAAHGVDGRFEVVSVGEPDADGTVSLELRRAGEVSL